MIFGASADQTIVQTTSLLKKLDTTHGHDLIEIFGIAVNALTSNEARYLVGFRTADDIRNRLAKAKQEIDLRQ